MDNLYIFYININNAFDILKTFKSTFCIKGTLAVFGCSN